MDATHHAAHDAALVPPRAQLHLALRHLRVRVRVRVRARVCRVRVRVRVRIRIRVRLGYLLLTTYNVLRTSHRLGVVGVVHVLLDEALERAVGAVADVAFV